jgi:hypothetical protein
MLGSLELLGEIANPSFLKPDIVGDRIMPALSAAVLLVGIKEFHQCDIGRTHQAIPLQKSIAAAGTPRRRPLWHGNCHCTTAEAEPA